MQAQEMARDKQINFRVTEEEAERFDRVAQHLGLSLASMIRSLVKEKDNELHADVVKSLKGHPTLDEDELFKSACKRLQRQGREPWSHCSGAVTQSRLPGLELRGSDGGDPIRAP